jgi:hypothetical protein
MVVKVATVALKAGRGSRESEADAMVVEVS